MTEEPKHSELAIIKSPEIETSIRSFHPALEGYVAGLGLPTDNVLSPVDERKKIINSLGDVLSMLPLEERAKATYITRFIVAVTVGLFDGALAYLWDETIRALRKLVARFDLAYFFSVAEKVNPRCKNLHTEDDLDEVSDHDLLEACRRIGLINDVNYQRLEHINYMRNHASAAHPNNNDIDGYELVGWLSNCLRYAILAAPDHSVIQVRTLLVNVRTQAVPTSDFPIIGDEIAKLSEERIDDLVWTLFGMYVDPSQEAQTKTNIAGIGPYVWSVASEDRKYDIGARFGTYRKNAEVSRKEAAEEFLRVVGGNAYKDEDSLAGELIDKLGTLKSVHYGFNNFYNEYPHAKTLGESLPRNGLVPRAARALWVKVISTCFIGNGLGYRQGVDESALPYYKKHVSSFSEAEIIEFVHLFTDAEFITPLGYQKCEQRAKALANELHDKASNISLKKALKLIMDAPQGTLGRIAATSAFKSELQLVPKPR